MNDAVSSDGSEMVLRSAFLTWRGGDDGTIYPSLGNSAGRDACSAEVSPGCGPRRPALRAAIGRRPLLGLISVLTLCPVRLLADVSARAAGPKGSLLTAPIELGGAWKWPEPARRVVTRVREVCLSGVRLVSDRQPARLRVDNHSPGPPAIWLHDDPESTAWILVDVGPSDWCKLAYQLGHELGHVLCNSWDRNAKPRPPSQWLEEAMVEAFSIRGLALLAASWESNPPFAGDAAFAAAIRDYRAQLIRKYGTASGQPSPPDAAAWFRENRAPLENGASHIPGPAVLAVLAVLENDGACVEDLGAVNRWRSRTGVPLEEYLVLWETSCRELGAAGRLPGRLRETFLSVRSAPVRN